MKRIVTFLIFVILMTTSTIIYANLPTKTKVIRENLSQELLIEESFLRSMTKEISKAIENNYGEYKKYFLPRITLVTKNESEDNFDVTVQVVTYERAILPPYGLENLTFRIPGYTVINFVHEEIRGKICQRINLTPI